jgi:hypothetical protein
MSGGAFADVIPSPLQFPFPCKTLGCYAGEVVYVCCSHGHCSFELMVSQLMNDVTTHWILFFVVQAPVSYLVIISTTHIVDRHPLVLFFQCQ